MLKNIVFDMGNVLLVYNPYQACLRYARDPEKARLLLDAIFETPQWWELIDGGVLTDVEYIPNAQSRLETPELRQLRSGADGLVFGRALSHAGHGDGGGIAFGAGMPAVLAVQRGA